MKKIDQHSKKSRLTRYFVNHNAWMTLIIGLSIILIVILELLTYQQQQTQQTVTAKLESIHLARINLNDGLLYINLADSTSSPSDLAQGQALLQQAINFLNNNAVQDTARDGQSISGFQTSVNNFQEALTQWNQDGRSDPNRIVQLQAAFSALDLQVDRLDTLTQQSLNRITERLKFYFAFTLATSVVLFVGFLSQVYFLRKTNKSFNSEIIGNEESYHQLIQMIPVSLGLVRNDGRISMVNDHFVKMFGYTLQDIPTIDDWWKRAYPDEEYRIWATEIWNNSVDKAIKESDDIQPTEFHVTCKDGRRLRVEISGIAFQGNLLAIFTDITDRKKAEEALLESEKKYRLIFDHAADGFFIANEKGNFLDINASGSAILGYPREEISRFNFGDLLIAEDRENYRSLFNKVQKRQNASSQYKVLQKDGKVLDVGLNLSTLPDGRILGMIRNISELKRTENQIQATQQKLQNLLNEADLSRKALLSMVEDHKLSEEKIRQLNAELEQRVKDRTAQLQAANLELEAFSYSVSHDLRAPLRALDGYSNLLLTDYPDRLDEQGRHYLTRIQEGSKRMGELIEDLLNLSRITRSDFVRKQVNLSSIALETVKSVKDQEPERKVQFDIAPDLVVDGDPRLLRIVLENLINNAMKFTSKLEVANIQFGMNEKNGEKVYFVRDNGVGFDMAYANKLFTPFQRLHKVQEFPGTGIGLVVVQRIITRHGGRIWPEAEINKGATFNFTLGEKNES